MKWAALVAASVLTALPLTFNRYVEPWSTSI